MGDGFYRSIVGLAGVTLAGRRVRIITSGSEHIPLVGGAVLASNHIGFLDFVFVGAAAKERGRLVRFMCKKEVFDNPVGGPVMRGMGHIPVDRAAGSASYAQSLRELRGGELVGLFPEGTISRSYEPMPFKTGATAMAAAAGVPLLPVAIWGSQRVWTKAGHRFAPTEAVPLMVSIGAPHGVRATRQPRRGHRTRTRSGHVAGSWLAGQLSRYSATWRRVVAAGTPWRLGAHRRSRPRALRPRRRPASPPIKARRMATSPRIPRRTAN